MSFLMSIIDGTLISNSFGTAGLLVLLWIFYKIFNIYQKNNEKSNENKTGLIIKIDSCIKEICELGVLSQNAIGKGRIDEDNWTGRRILFREEWQEIKYIYNLKKCSFDQKEDVYIVLLPALEVYKGSRTKIEEIKVNGWWDDITEADELQVKKSIDDQINEQINIQYQELIPLAQKKIIGIIIKMIPEKYPVCFYDSNKKLIYRRDASFVKSKNSLLLK